jgi:hypothetical protein
MPARQPEPIDVDGRPMTVHEARSRLAARRRRSMAVLFAVLLITTGMALVGLIPLWSMVIPGLLVLAFVLHLRGQVAQQHALDARRRRQAEVIAERRGRTGGASASRGLDVETVLPVTRPLAAGTIGPAFGAAFTTADEIRDDVVEAPAAAVASAEFYDAARDTRSWEPVPVPLPTYVLAPKAPRSVRVIDLTLPGAWTSGYLDEDELAALEQERREDARLQAEASSRVRLERASGDSIVVGEVVIERSRAVGD